MDEHLLRAIALFNEREFFRCHEVLEEAWTPERGPRRLFLQALIHVAVGLYHHQRGNPTGACRQLRKALRKLSAYLPACEGVQTGRLYGDATGALRSIEAGEPLPAYPTIHSDNTGGTRFASATCL